MTSATQLAFWRRLRRCRGVLLVLLIQAQFPSSNYWAKSPELAPIMNPASFPYLGRRSTGPFVRQSAPRCRCQLEPIPFLALCDRRRSCLILKTCEN